MNVSGQPRRSVRPGQILLLPPDVRHSFEWDTVSTTVHGYVHFEVQPLGLGLTVPVVREMSPDDPAAAVCRYLLRDDVRADAQLQPALDAAIAFLVQLMTGPGALDDPPGRLQPIVAAAIDFLRVQWSTMPLSRVTVDELARAAGCSAAQLSRLFSATYAAGPAGVMERARLARAQQLLIRSDLTLYSIAKECGFADGSHLAHRFAAIHGVSPGRFRVERRSDDAVSQDRAAAFARAVWPG